MSADPSPVEAARRAWYQATDARGQGQAVRQLVALAADPAGRARPAAVSALIGLLHGMRASSERVALIEALGEVDHVVAVPALHAETHHPDPQVRRAAFASIGRLGLAFGGVMVARWLHERELSEEPRAVLQAALVALARTGNGAVGLWAERLWAAGRVTAATLHAALAEAASPALLPLAYEHLSRPDAAIPAALHLASRRVEDLEAALSPLRRSGDLVLAQVAERLVNAPRPEAEDHLMEVLQRSGSLPERARAARTLRVHDPLVLARAFDDLTSGDEAGSPEAQRHVEVALWVGVPELQDAALRHAERGGPRALSRALAHVGVRSPGLEARWRAWAQHDDALLVAGAIRAWANLGGPAALPELERFATSPRPVQRLERVRAWQNSLRDQRGTDGRTRLGHAERAEAERALREALQDPDPDVAALAAFTVGNLGLSALTQALAPLLRAEWPERVRLGAATALADLPAWMPVGELAERFRVERDANVRFRLGEALIAAIERFGAAPTDTQALAAAAHAGLADREDVATLALALLGHVPGEAVLARLASEAGGAVQARATAALEALRWRADPAASGVLGVLARHPDDARRRLATEALAALQTPDAVTSLIERAVSESDLEIRRAALVALRGRALAPKQAARLRPSGEDDPLLVEVLQALERRPAGRKGESMEIDARLLELAPRLPLAAMQGRCPDALRALRTAEYLSEGGKLPAGLDAGPAPIFWVKGLEIWLHDIGAVLLQPLRNPRAMDRLHDASARWGALQPRAKGWAQPRGTDLWRFLLDGLLKGLDRSEERVLGLRDMAAAALVTGPLAEEFGLPRHARWTSEEATRAAAAWCRLAHLRNPLTHSRAARADDVREAREAAAEGLIGAIALAGGQ